MPFDALNENSFSQPYLPALGVVRLSRFFPSLGDGKHFSLWDLHLQLEGATDTLENTRLPFWPFRFQREGLGPRVWGPLPWTSEDLA